MQHQVLFLSMHVDLVKSQNGKSQHIFTLYWSKMHVCLVKSDGDSLVWLIINLLHLQSFILDLEKGKM
jgi:hypothetical protein